jgi:hypothetical protein
MVVVHMNLIFFGVSAEREAMDCGTALSLELKGKDLA